MAAVKATVSGGLELYRRGLVESIRAAAFEVVLEQAEPLPSARADVHLLIAGSAQDPLLASPDGIPIVALVAPCDPDRLADWARGGAAAVVLLDAPPADVAMVAELAARGYRLFPPGVDLVTETGNRPTLTPAELRVLEALHPDRTIEQAAAALPLHPRSVKKVLARVREVLGLDDLRSTRAWYAQHRVEAIAPA